MLGCLNLIWNNDLCPYGYGLFLLDLLNVFINNFFDALSRDRFF